jgi:hypothetical protein
MNPTASYREGFLHHVFDFDSKTVCLPSNAYKEIPYSAVSLI